MAEVEKQIRPPTDDVSGVSGEVIPLFPQGSEPSERVPDDDELALLIACGATIERIAHRLGRDLAEIYRDLVALRLALEEELPAADPVSESVIG